VPSSRRPSIQVPARGRSQKGATWARRNVLLAVVGSLAFVLLPSRDALAAKKWQRGADIWSLDGRRVTIAEAIINSGVSTALEQLPEAWPFGPADFRRWDEGDDARGFVEPSFERHIDDPARLAMERFYVELLIGAPRGLRVLDVCASWDSHLPTTLDTSRVALVGMSWQELEANRVATDVHTCDLNRDPCLPFRDAAFDVVTLALSVQYLTRPQEVFQEIHRVLRPGGLAVVPFSSLSFPWKVVPVWSKSFHDGAAQSRTIGTYFKFSPVGGWHRAASLDLSPHKSSMVGSNPLWAVVAIKA